MTSATHNETQPRVPPVHRSRLIQTGISGAEICIYIVVAALLLVAVTFTVVGTIIHVLEGAHSRRI
jgi:hypothetical protein